MSVAEYFFYQPQSNLVGIRQNAAKEAALVGIGMQLLFSRDQSAGSFSLVPLRVGGGVTFSLRAQLELDEAEKDLLNKYKLTTAPLIVSDTLDDIRGAFRSALVVGVLTYITFWFLSGFLTAVTIALIVIGVMTGVYFFALREQLNIHHLMGRGHVFYCFSVRELVEKEAYLEGTCQYLRQLLESAKHWGGRETVQIPPLDKEAAKQAILQSK